MKALNRKGHLYFLSWAAIIKVDAIESDSMIVLELGKEDHPLESL
jgi:general stress protein 26